MGTLTRDPGGHFFALLDRRASALGRRMILLASLGGALLLGLIDEVTGTEISFSIFYLAPVAAAAWYAGLASAVAVCLCAATIWLVADLRAGATYSTDVIPVWNATVRLGFFYIVARLLLALRGRLRAEEELAASDPLTGLANRRRFVERLEDELARARRYRETFTLAYVDLDGFKAVNDRFGHAEGDRVLRSVAERIRTMTRGTDVVARLGGDEFAVLLPRSGEGAARHVLPALHDDLRSAMAEAGWPVDFSVGAVCFTAPAGSAEEALHAADELMYEVKRSGKGAIRYLSRGENA